MTNPNSAWGEEYIERALRLRYRLDQDRRHHADAVATAESPPPLEPGDPVEAKACRAVIDTSRGPEHGRVWIGSDSFDRLVQEEGYLAVAVYQPGHPRGPILRVELFRAEAFGARYIDGWTNNGDRHNNAEERSVQVYWTDIFPTLDDPRPRSTPDLKEVLDG